jgi:hypothetical protein
MKKRGIGIGCMFYGIGYGFSRQDIAAAEVEICEDGSVIVRSGEVDFGQGSDTIFCQIVAEGSVSLRHHPAQCGRSRHPTQVPLQAGDLKETPCPRRYGP